MGKCEGQLLHREEKEERIPMSEGKTFGRFPLFLDIHTWKILVVGGGAVAARRIRVLSGFGPRITVLAPALDPCVQEAVRCGSIRHRKGVYEEEILDREDWDMVLCAADDARLNRSICAACRTRSILCNNASDRNDCDFFFPAIVRGKGLVIGMVSDGSDHARVRDAAARIREEYGESDNG